MLHVRSYEYYISVTPVKLVRNKIEILQISFSFIDFFSIPEEQNLDS